MQTKAIVIGSGMGGLATAQVLSEYFDNVIVIEKDHADKTMQKSSVEAANTASARHGVMQVRSDPADTDHHKLYTCELVQLQYCSKPLHALKAKRN